MQCLFWFIVCDSWLALLEKMPESLWYHFFNWILYLFTFQMLSSFLISPQKLCIPPLHLLQWACVPQQTYSCLLALAITYTGALSFLGTRGLFCHWDPRPNFTTYNARVTLNVVNILCGTFPLAIYSLNETLSFHNEILFFFNINLQCTIWTPMNF